MTDETTAAAPAVQRTAKRAYVRRAVRTETHKPVHAEVRAPARRERKRKGGMALDQFAIDAEMIPDGMSYEWKRMSTFGARDPSYEVLMAEQGWEPVPVSRHPQFMPANYKGPIERGGLVLMERPVELTQEARDEAARDAYEVVRVKEEQLGMTPSGTLSREHPSAKANTYVNRSYEPVPIPE